MQQRKGERDGTLKKCLTWLEPVRWGVDEAQKILKDLPYEDLGYAKLDHHRALRSGFGETVFCQGKPDEYLVEIYRKFFERDGEVFGTRATKEQFELVKAAVPEVTYDSISRILKVEKKDKLRKGCVAVCTGGTADIPVAEEAAQTAEYFGSFVDRIYDVGVAGIHRLLSNRGPDWTGQLHHSGSRDGRRSWNGNCRNGGMSCDCGAYIGRIRSQLSRLVSIINHAQLLC